MGLNLTGVFLGMKYAMQAMKENSGGSIINMASVEGIIGARMTMPTMPPRPGCGC